MRSLLLLIPVIYKAFNIVEPKKSWNWQKPLPTSCSLSRETQRKAKRVKGYHHLPYYFHVVNTAYDTSSDW